MRINIIALLLISISALIFTGCDGGTSQMGSKEANLLGIAKVSKAHYQPSGSATFPVSTDELYTRKNFGGNQVTLLWGLITLKDY
ncbi:MAG: hypothetical protein MK130_08530 [Puniceicoccaceae bacterium]|nr:hypothetical protein [Puniceicoccaceae bacterium]